jgi:hypothetical protein
MGSLALRVRFHGVDACHPNAFPAEDPLDQGFLSNRRATSRVIMASEMSLFFLRSWVLAKYYERQAYSHYSVFL